MNRKVAWYHKHGDAVRARRRELHALAADDINAKRRARYATRASEVTAKMRADRIECPHCHKSYRRLYMPRHIANRHPQCISLPINHPPSPIAAPTEAPAATPKGPANAPTSAPARLAMPAAAATPMPPAAAPPLV